MSDSTVQYDKTITVAEFAEIFGVRPDELPVQAREVIETADFRYRVLTGIELLSTYIRVFKTLLTPIPKEKVSGPHRKGVWEKGWGENLEGFTKTGDLKELRAKFVRLKELIRYKGHYIDPADAHFEENFVKVLRHFLFRKYFTNTKQIYEFGFGAGLNLVAASAIFPDKKLIGLDWASASAQIASKLAEVKKMNITGRVFDLFNPDETLKIEPNSAVFSIGTLEQTGRNFKAFTDYLIRQKPAICINIETMYEVYNKFSLFDCVAASYLKKRNYLRGYLTYLRELEKAGKVEILEVKRTFGSFYHDGYTYIVWRPK